MLLSLKNRQYPDRRCLVHNRIDSLLTIVCKTMQIVTVSFYN